MKRSKYGNKRTSIGSRTYDSGAEARRGAMLQLMEKSGNISDLQFQVTFKLSEAEVTYRADYTYMENGRLVAEDMKGVRTERFRLIVKLWRVYGPCLLRVTSWKHNRLCVVQEVMGRQA